MPPTSAIFQVFYIFRKEITTTKEDCNRELEASKAKFNRELDSIKEKHSVEVQELKVFVLCQVYSYISAFGCKTEICNQDQTVLFVTESLKSDSKLKSQNDSCDW